METKQKYWKVIKYSININQEDVDVFEVKEI